MNPIHAVLKSDQVYTSTSNKTELYQTDSVQEVLELLAKASTDDLVIFDVDEVLITLKDQFLRPIAAEESDPIFFSIFCPLSEPEKEKLFGEWISQVEVEPVTEELIKGIHELQNRGLRLIGLTRMIPGAGPCGKIPSMEDFRFNELHERGINFRDHFEIKEFEFDLPEKNGRKPLFKDGILYARPYAKGEVLESFLEKTGITPKRIWFVDNDQKHVDSVLEVMKELEIPYTGIQYLDKKFSEEQYDLKLGEFQFHHFKETNIWLNDEEAKIAMEQ